MNGSDYKCQNNYEHLTFKKDDGNYYMSAIHLIPMSAQKDYILI